MSSLFLSLHASGVSFLIERIGACFAVYYDEHSQRCKIFKWIFFKWKVNLFHKQVTLTK